MAFGEIRDLRVLSTGYVHVSCFEKGRQGVFAPGIVWHGPSLLGEWWPRCHSLWTLPDEMHVFAGVDCRQS